MTATVRSTRIRIDYSDCAGEKQRRRGTIRDAFFLA